MLVTVALVVSIAILLAFEIEPAAPGVISVRVASFRAASRIVPEFSCRAEILE